MNDEIGLGVFPWLCGRWESLRRQRPRCQHRPPGSAVACGLPAEFECDDGGQTDRPRYVCREHLQYQIRCLGPLVWPPPEVPRPEFDAEGAILGPEEAARRAALNQREKHGALLLARWPRRRQPGTEQQNGSRPEAVPAAADLARRLQLGHPGTRAFTENPPMTIIERPFDRERLRSISRDGRERVAGVVAFAWHALLRLGSEPSRRRRASA